MRKIILYIADSLDGYIARKDGGIDWLFTDSDYGYNQFYSTIDTVLMGRKTYDKILDMGGDYHFSDKKGYVFTRKNSLQKTRYVEFVHDDLHIFVNNLKAAEGKDIWLIGGGEIVRYFLNESLIDVIIISIHPKILGDGLPLFIPPLRETDLKLTECIQFESGLIQIYYKILKK